jgi:Anti-sigma factor NepR
MEGSPGHITPLERFQRRKEIRSAIGRHLRALYENAEAAPIPDRILRLLRQLEATGAPRSNEPSSPRG